MYDSALLICLLDSLVKVEKKTFTEQSIFCLSLTFTSSFWEDSFTSLFHLPFNVPLFWYAQRITVDTKLSPKVFYTFGWACDLLSQSVWLPVQFFNLLVLVKNNHSSEDLTGDQRTNQSGDSCYLQSATVGTPDREKENNHFSSDLKCFRDQTVK